jgi:hypothetical protein
MTVQLGDRAGAMPLDAVSRILLNIIRRASFSWFSVQNIRSRQKFMSPTAER